MGKLQEAWYVLTDSATATRPVHLSFLAWKCEHCGRGLTQGPGSMILHACDDGSGALVRAAERARRVDGRRGPLRRLTWALRAASDRFYRLPPPEIAPLPWNAPFLWEPKLNGACAADPDRGSWKMVLRDLWAAMRRIP